MKEETRNFILTVITIGIILLSIVVLILMYLKLIGSPSLEEIIIGWLISLTISLVDMKSKFDLMWNDFKKRKKIA
jgi:hypothetical protein